MLMAIDDRAGHPDRKAGTPKGIIEEGKKSKAEDMTWVQNVSSPPNSSGEKGAETQSIDKQDQKKSAAVSAIEQRIKELENQPAIPGMEKEPDKQMNLPGMDKESKKEVAPEINQSK
jgi:hypothetical protein